MTGKDDDSASDELTVGQATSVFRFPFLHEPELAVAVGQGTVEGLEGLPPGSASVMVTRGPNAGSRFLLDQPTTSAGRHPASDIFLDDVTVSRRHAEFRWENADVHVVDLNSLNGTYLNGEQVDAAMLANGDEVQLGKFRLMFFHQSRTHTS